MIVSTPTIASTIVTNRPKLSAAMTPKPSALRFHSSTAETAAAHESDQPEAADGHALIPPAKRFGPHGGQGRQGDTEHRDDRVYLCVKHHKTRRSKGKRQQAQVKSKA